MSVRLYVFPEGGTYLRLPHKTREEILLMTPTFTEGGDLLPHTYCGGRQPHDPHTCPPTTLPTSLLTTSGTLYPNHDDNIL